jgi:hypothetical protein
MITPSYGLTATERVLPRMALDFTTAILDPRITFARTGNTATVTNSSGVIVGINADLPRFDYNPTTFVCRGLLIEEARTNSLLNSLLDGTDLATQLVTVTAAARTLSFYGTGTVVLSGSHSATVVGVGAYPTRTTLTFTPIAGVLTLTVTGTVQYAQLEAGAFATSFIPTDGTTKTRNADLATMTGTNFSSWYNQPEGTFSAQAIVPQLGRAGRILGVDSGTTANLFVMGTAATNQVSSDSVVASAYSGGAYSVGTITANTQFKMCSSYSNTTSEGTALNGAAISAANFSVGVTMTEMYIGTQVGPSSFLNGAIAKISYWPQKLTNNEVQAFSK